MNYHYGQAAPKHHCHLSQSCKDGIQSRWSHQVHSSNAKIQDCVTLLSLNLTRTQNVTIQLGLVLTAPTVIMPQETWTGRQDLPANSLSELSGDELEQNLCMLPAKSATRAKSLTASTAFEKIVAGVSTAA